MRIGTLTFHSADNYGAMLQAYALAKAVETLGYECEIIDYRQSAITSGVEVEWPGQLIKRYGLLKGGVKAVNRWRLGWFDKNRRNVKFNRFMEKRLPLSKKTYRFAEELKDIDYDAVLFGSDQIWNEKLTGGFAAEYFGQGIPGRKIAYAASSGTDSIPEKAMSMLKNFSALGIREKGLTETLQKNGLDAQTVLDPALLLTADQWREIETPLPKNLQKGKYIFVYAFDEWPVYDLARKISKEENLPMVIVRWCGRHERFNDMIQIPNCAPEEFLTLLDNAAVVCTSTFHGTAFSVVYGKRLYCIAPKECGERTTSLLSQVGLMSCMADNRTPLQETIDYEAAAKKLAALRAESMDFLKNALEAGE